MMIMALTVMVIFYDGDKRCFTEIRRIYITPQLKVCFQGTEPEIIPCIFHERRRDRKHTHNMYPVRCQGILNQVNILISRRRPYGTMWVCVFL